MVIIDAHRFGKTWDGCERNIMIIPTLTCSQFRRIVTYNMAIEIPVNWSKRTTCGRMKLTANSFLLTSGPFFRLEFDNSRPKYKGEKYLSTIHVHIMEKKDHSLKWPSDLNRDCDPAWNPESQGKISVRLPMCRLVLRIEGQFWEPVHWFRRPPVSCLTLVLGADLQTLQ